MKLCGFLLILLSSACTLLDNNPVESIQIVSKKDANDNQQTLVDIVFIYEDGVKLPETAEEWFAGDKQRVLTVPTEYKVVSMRVPPALISDVVMPSQSNRAKKVLAYVNFENNGKQAPLDLTRYANPVILLDDDNYRLSWRR